MWKRGAQASQSVGVGLPGPSTSWTTTRQTHDLLDNLCRGGQVDESLVDSHLESVPGL